MRGRGASPQERSLQAAVKALHQRHDAYSSLCRLKPAFRLRGRGASPQERSLQAAVKALHQRHDAYSSLCRL